MCILHSNSCTVLDSFLTHIYEQLNILHSGFRKAIPQAGRSRRDASVIRSELFPPDALQQFGPMQQPSSQDDLTSLAKLFLQQPHIFRQVAHFFRHSFHYTFHFHLSNIWYRKFTKTLEIFGLSFFFHLSSSGSNLIVWHETYQGLGSMPIGSQTPASQKLLVWTKVTLEQS